MTEGICRRRELASSSSSRSHDAAAKFGMRGIKSLATNAFVMSCRRLRWWDCRRRRNSSAFVWLLIEHFMISWLIDEVDIDDAVVIEAFICARLNSIDLYPRERDRWSEAMWKTFSNLEL